MTSTAQKIIIGAAVFVLLGFAVIGVLIGAAVYGWKAAQRAGNEAATLQNMKTIAAVEVRYYNTHNRTFGTFDQLIRERMLTSKFSGESPAPDGYILTLKVTPGSTDRQSFYALNADPQSASAGKNHFYMESASESIHVNPDEPAGATDPLQRSGAISLFMNRKNGWLFILLRDTKSHFVTFRVIRGSSFAGVGSDPQNHTKPHEKL